MYKKKLLNKKGFTLIELLAVLVILAVISLITAPIVINLTDESKKSAKLVAARNYLRAAENAVSLSSLNNKAIEDGVYMISSDGEICLYGLKDNKCLGNKDDIVSLEISGETPDKGFVTISSGIITNIDLYYDDQILSKTGNEDFITPIYRVGQEIKFDPGIGKMTWNVISETKDTVTLMLNQNLPKLPSNEQLVVSYNQIFDELCAMDSSSFTNVDYIKNFSYSNYEGVYKNIEITNGNVTITDNFDNKRTLSGKTKMRILTFEEAYKIILMNDPRAAYELSDAKLDDNFEFVLDAQMGMTLEEAEAQGIKSWDDVREFILKEEPALGVNNIIRRYGQITNIHMILYSEAGVFDDPNVNFPSWLDSNLGNSWYALLTTVGTGIYSSIDASPAVVIQTMNYPTGIRPVIEIPKSKLK